MGTVYGEKNVRRLLFIMIVLIGPMLVAQSSSRAPVSPLADEQAGLPAKPEIPPLPELPPLSPLKVRSGGALMNAGTAGRVLRAPDIKNSTTFAILADRTGGTDAGLKYLRTAIDELNLLEPEFVMTVGDLVQGYTRDPAEYIRQVVEYRGITDRLKMPWYPCAGNHDVISGLRNPDDRRFEELYQNYFGPLYYSLDYGDIHLVVLYTDEQRRSEPELSEQQITWLSADLNRAFNNGTTRHVFVFMHKPAWRYEKSNWDKVHKLLVDFNSRPIVAVEGMSGRAATVQPRVEAVFAGHLHSYIQEPVRDGIPYYVLSVTGAGIDQAKTAGQFNQYLLVKVTQAGAEFAIVEPGSVYAKDYVTKKDRDVLDRIYRIDDATMGISGVLDEPVARPIVTINPGGILPAPAQPAPAPLELKLKNPLDVPLTVNVRMAGVVSVGASGDALEQEAASSEDRHDSSWQLNMARRTFTLAPGETQSAPLTITWPMSPGQKAPGEVAWPQVDLVVTYQDSKGRSVPTILHRRVPVVPQVTVPVINTAPAEHAWKNAYHARTHPLAPNTYDQVDLSPDVYLLADRNTLWLKIHVADLVRAYYPDFSEPHYLPSDAVAFSFMPAGETSSQKMTRIVVLPFAPDGPLLLTNTGALREQTKLLPAGQQWQITARVTSRKDAWDLYLGIPRKILPGGGFAGNVVITDNDDSGQSSFRSWGRDIPGLMPKVSFADE